MAPSHDILARPTLVLNRSWQPIHVTTVVRALVMLWNDSARVVDPEDYRFYTWPEWTALPSVDGRPCIRSAHARIRVPEVVALQHFDRMPTSAVAFSRRNVARRDHFTCQYCGTQPGVSDLTIDHVVPRAHGGQSSWTNCVAACAECNAYKADRTPEQAGMRLRKIPVRPTWKPLYALQTLAQARQLHGWDAFIDRDAGRTHARRSSGLA